METFRVRRCVPARRDLAGPATLRDARHDVAPGPSSSQSGRRGDQWLAADHDSDRTSIPRQTQHSDNGRERLTRTTASV